MKQSFPGARRGRARAVAAGLVLAVTGFGAGEPADAALVGETRSYVTRAEDTLLDVARRFDLGYVELRAANPGVDPWLPGAGVELVLPTGHLLPDAPPRGIVINLTEMRLYVFDKAGRAVATHPIGIGRRGWETPLGETRIVRKRTDPAWIPPKSIRALKPSLPKVVPPGPNNPLGRYALDLGWPAYLIHGTNNPWGIGRRVSSGCIRLYPEDIESLYGRAAVGTPVTVVDQPFKVGWVDGELYIEVHPSRAQADEIEAEGRIQTRGSLSGLVERIVAVAGEATARLDWEAVRRAASMRDGVPVRVTRERVAERKRGRG